MVWIYQSPTEGHLGHVQFGAIDCISLTEGWLVLPQAAEPPDFLMSSQDLSPLSVTMHPQSGESTACHELALQLRLTPSDPSGFKWHIAFSEKSLCEWPSPWPGSCSSPESTCPLPLYPWLWRRTPHAQRAFVESQDWQQCYHKAITTRDHDTFLKQHDREGWPSPHGSCFLTCQIVTVIKKTSRALRRFCYYR